MSDETIVAIYDTADHAQAAVAALKAAGVPADAIGTHAADGASGTAAGIGSTGVAPVREEGFWASLFGGSPDHDTAVYDRSLSGGSTVVSVKTPDAHVTRVLDILESHSPIDIDERAASYGLTAGTTTTAAAPVATPVMDTSVNTSAATPAALRTPAPVDTTSALGTAARTAGTDATLQLAEESLAVGKRLVNRGGTRIRRFVVETPVEENVSLHSEKVTLERRPVTDGRPVADSFTDRTIEMTETAEEAVVSKTARVYEEVALRKEATDRVETVRDTVRKEEAEVVQIPATETVTTGRTTGTTAGTNTTPVPPKRT